MIKSHSMKNIHQNTDIYSLSKPQLHFAYGKPNKPRQYEPSMYEILSWAPVIEPPYYQETQQIFTGVENNSKPLDIEQGQKNMGLSNQAGETILKARKNGINQDINKCNEQNSQNRQYEYKGNTVEKDTIYQKKKPQKQLKKKNKLPYQSPNNFRQNKPRYMEPRKTAIDKFIESNDFDEEKFSKLKANTIKRFKQTSRDLSNSAFLTYFNKPPFQNYGRCNKNPAGLLYGDDMYTHNVFPHTGDNRPENKQTYSTALRKAKSSGNIKPHPTLNRKLQNSLITDYLTLSQVYPEPNQQPSLPITKKTKLQNLPQFNLDSQKKSQKNIYLHGFQGSNLMMDPYRYENNEGKHFFSTKKDIEGKQISYHKRLNSTKQIA